ncbi:hypothetical protein PR048_029459 [Dryococelus australis]|uniref:Uncharacterized protein n=1 Tax=Dryococelus australis TaxID=614101 RepID=A0ABQ9GE29_9NEOP|nr:hypothetical protein PR048_029459 [Dryococelus australis]
MKGPEETGDTRGNPPTNGIVQHDSNMRKSGVTRPGIEPGSPWWEASRLTAQPPRPHAMKGHRLNYARSGLLELCFFRKSHTQKEPAPKEISDIDPRDIICRKTYPVHEGKANNTAVISAVGNASVFSRKKVKLELAVAYFPRTRLLHVERVRQQDFRKKESPVLALQDILFGDRYTEIGLVLAVVETLHARGNLDGFSSTEELTQLLDRHYGGRHSRLLVTSPGERHLPPLYITLISAWHNATWPDSLASRGDSCLPGFGQYESRWRQLVALITALYLALRLHGDYTNGSQENHNLTRVNVRKQALRGRQACSIVFREGGDDHAGAREGRRTKDRAGAAGEDVFSWDRVLRRDEEQEAGSHSYYRQPSMTAACKDKGSRQLTAAPGASSPAAATAAGLPGSPTWRGPAGLLALTSSAAELLASHLGEPGFDSRRSRFPDFRTRRCCRSAGFLGDLPFLPHLHSGAAPYSPRFTLIASQGLHVKGAAYLAIESLPIVPAIHCLKRAKNLQVAGQISPLHYNRTRRRDVGTSFVSQQPVNQSPAGSAANRETFRAMHIPHHDQQVKAVHGMQTNVLGAYAARTCTSNHVAQQLEEKPVPRASHIQSENGISSLFAYLLFVSARAKLLSYRPHNRIRHLFTKQALCLRKEHSHKGKCELVFLKPVNLRRPALSFAVSLLINHV